MNRDFRVGQSNELIKGERIYDLHNCFDFDGLELSKPDELRLFFKPNPIHGRGHTKVLVYAQGVDRLSLSSGFGPKTVKDLEEIGYKSPGDDDDNWLLSQKQADPYDDLFFRFNDGHFVRFHSKSALLIETSAASDSPPS
jgi:hypothetical protein